MTFAAAMLQASVPVTATAVIALLAIVVSVITTLWAGSRNAAKVAGAFGERLDNVEKTQDEMKRTDRDQWKELTALRKEHAQLDKKIAVIEERCEERTC